MGAAGLTFLEWRNHAQPFLYTSFSDSLFCVLYIPATLSSPGSLWLAPSSVLSVHLSQDGHVCPVCTSAQGWGEEEQSLPVPGIMETSLWG